MEGLLVRILALHGCQNRQQNLNADCFSLFKENIERFHQGNLILHTNFVFHTTQNEVITIGTAYLN
jgi:hypothetical protein